MATDQLLDLFSLDKTNTKAVTVGQSDVVNKHSSDGGKRNVKAILDNLDELWDCKQYEMEYDMDNFLQGLKHN